MLNSLRYTSGIITQTINEYKKKSSNKVFIHVYSDHLRIRCSGNVTTVEKYSKTMLEDEDINVYCVRIHDNPKWLYGSNPKITTHMIIFDELLPADYKYVALSNTTTNSVVLHGLKVNFTPEIIPWVAQYKNVRFWTTNPLNIKILEGIKGRLFGYDCHAIHGPEYFPLCVPAEGLEIGMLHADVDEYCRCLALNPRMYYLEVHSPDITTDDLVKIIRSCPLLVDFKIISPFYEFDEKLFEELPSSVQFLTLDTMCQVDVNELMKSNTQIRWIHGNISFDMEVFRNSPHVIGITNNGDHDQEELNEITITRLKAKNKKSKD